MATTTPRRPPGWYPDVTGRHQYRYWNGDAWTEEVADRGQVQHETPPAPPGAPTGATTRPAAPPPAPPTTALRPPTRPRRGRRPRLVLVAVLALAGLAVAGVFAYSAATDGPTAEEEAREELDTLQARAEDATTDAEAEAVLTDVLTLAGDNAGQPVGDDAFAFAETTYLEWLNAEGDWPYMVTEPIFVDEIPPPPEGDWGTYGPIASRIGFTEAVPDPYVPSEVLAENHAALVDEVDFVLTDLEQTLADRRQWVDEIRGGETGVSWGTTGYLLDEVSPYHRDLAVRAGETPEFLAGWDATVNAVDVGDWTPPAAETGMEGDVITRTFTPAAIDEAAANNDELAGAVAAARAAFPAPGEGAAA